MFFAARRTEHHTCLAGKCTCLLLWSSIFCCFNTTHLVCSMCIYIYINKILYVYIYIYNYDTMCICIYIYYIILLHMIISWYIITMPGFVGFFRLNPHDIPRVKSPSLPVRHLQKHWHHTGRAICLGKWGWEGGGQRAIPDQRKNLLVLNVGNEGIMK